MLSQPRRHRPLQMGQQASRAQPRQSVRTSSKPGVRFSPNAKPKMGLAWSGAGVAHADPPDDNQPRRKIGIVNLVLIGVGVLLLLSSFISQGTAGAAGSLPYSLTRSMTAR